MCVWFLFGYQNRFLVSRVSYLYIYISIYPDDHLPVPVILLFIRVPVQLFLQMEKNRFQCPLPARVPQDVGTCGVESWPLSVNGKRNLEVLWIPFGYLTSLWKMTHLSMIYVYLQYLLEMVISIATVNHQKVNTRNSKTCYCSLWSSCWDPFQHHWFSAAPLKRKLDLQVQGVLQMILSQPDLIQEISIFWGCQTGRNCMTDLDGCWRLVNVNDIIHLMVIWFNITYYKYDVQFSTRFLHIFYKHVYLFIPKSRCHFSPWACLARSSSTWSKALQRHRQIRSGFDVKDRSSRISSLSHSHVNKYNYS